jgi:hypothetical protein
MERHSDQIELNLNPPPAGATVIPFPLRHRRRKIVKAARTLEARRTEDGQTRFWNRTVGDLAAELRRHGVDDETTKRELQSFHDAVSAELSRDDRQRPGGAR